MYNKEELINTTKELYNKIDISIDKLLKAKSEKDITTINETYYYQETLLVQTMQQLDCLISYIDNISQ